jgi:hypothetical protein
MCSSQERYGEQLRGKTKRKQPESQTQKTATATFAPSAKPLRPLRSCLITDSPADKFRPAGAKQSPSPATERQPKTVNFRQECASKIRECETNYSCVHISLGP